MLRYPYFYLVVFLPLLLSIGGEGRCAVFTRNDSDVTTEVY